MASVLVCIALSVCSPARGGVAHPVERGGAALAIDPPVRTLARFRDWLCIHSHEAAWNADTGNGYHGGLQMDWNFMRAYGRSMLARYHGRGAEAWTPAEQIRVAERAYLAGRGFNPWPQTARMCGLL